MYIRIVHMYPEIQYDLIVSCFFRIERQRENFKLLT